MSAKTSIEWCDHTFNPWIGCQKVSPGCRNCYAEVDTFPRVQRHRGRELWGPEASRHRTAYSYWRAPLKWNAHAANAGVRRRVFCASMADVFEDRRELTEWRRELWNLITRTPALDWLLLTKRPENFGRFLPWMPCEDGLVCKRMDGIVCPEDSCDLGDGVAATQPWPHVTLGVSVESRDQLHRIDLLRQTPAFRRFVSLEPLLEDLGDIDLGGINQAILGGESGRNARRCDVSWIRSGVGQCRAQGVAAFVKQLGARVFDRAFKKRQPGATTLGLNDATAWPQCGGLELHDDGCTFPMLADPKGGDPAEWPEDLRVREFPS